MRLCKVCVRAAVQGVRACGRARCACVRSCKVCVYVNISYETNILGPYGLPMYCSDTEPNFLLISSCKSAQNWSLISDFVSGGLKLSELRMLVRARGRSELFSQRDLMVTQIF